ASHLWQVRRLRMPRAIRQPSQEVSRTRLISCVRESSWNCSSKKVRCDSSALATDAAVANRFDDPEGEVLDGGGHEMVPAERICFLPQFIRQTSVPSNASVTSSVPSLWVLSANRLFFEWLFITIHMYTIMPLA